VGFKRDGGRGSDFNSSSNKN